MNTHLHLAVILMEDPMRSSGRWHRVVALLLRRSLEGSMDHLMPEMSDVRSTRARLLVLKDRIDPNLAADTADAYARLSTMIHHHAYELPPNLAELQNAAAVATRLHEEAATV